MCLIALAWRVVPGYRLIVAANRDEYHARPTAPAAFWGDAPDVFGGRDLKDGGSWMGVSRQGRFAALTNHRDPAAARTAQRSRGHLVADFLRATTPAATYAAALCGERSHYNGFNLLAGDGDALWYLGNHEAAPEPLVPGIHVLSNARLNTPWPKATGLAAELDRAIRRSRDKPSMSEALFAALADTDVPEDAVLPDTGIARERERKLGSRMIVDPVYGTRSSSVLLLGEDLCSCFEERSFDPRGVESGRVRQSIVPSASAQG